MRTIIILILAYLLQACSTAYVLHWRQPKRSIDILDVLGKPKESSAIPHHSGLALLYNRSQWVPIEEVNADRSAWVYYEVILDNCRTSVAQFYTQSLRLEGKEKQSVPAIYQKSSRVQTLETVQKNSRYQLPVRFQLNPEMIRHYANSQEPLILVVPLAGTDSGKELRLPLWLWRSS